ncbi:alpha-ketoacid dehydrogenase subunit beta [Deinococcus pimensis]|uniref:alpha-ketoacid dehydrogenase subunit beta n=1 Tax=Deinococcus pimensis TaxID=309888 RepID=UPI00048012A7|nr:alpha-ketoacid dehydrogenase subunit beta [Deinococcus pimensis]
MTTAVDTTTYRDALREALREGLRRDPHVVILGEEVGRYGGAYGVTSGLLDEFGEDRVLDTPISEAGIVGAAVGAALAGLRPVVELMYVDFAALAMDQIVNQAAKARSMFGGQTGVPLVLRTQGGTGRSAGAQHSQSLEAWFLHTPGLRLYVPATVTDAHHLLLAALREPDPVVFVEHKALYTTRSDLGAHAPPPGVSVRRREGRDVTVVTYSRMLHRCLDAAQALAARGVEADVIDLRTLCPLDLEPVVASARRTGRVLIVTEDTLTGGVSAELAARVTELAFDWLEEPPMRLAGEDVPIPVAPALEEASVPTPLRIERAALRLLGRRA